MIRPIVMARTRHVYGSYTYFWHLVELAGLATCYVDEIDLSSDAVYIITPMNGEFAIQGEYAPAIQAKVAALSGRPRKAILVWYNIERPGGETLQDPARAPEELRKAIAWATPQKIDQIWMHDRYFAAMDPRILAVPIGSDARLRQGTAIRPYRYDLCHFLYVNHRRSRILGALSDQGLRIGPPDWNAGRNDIWNSSKMILSVHQSPVAGGEQLRFAAAAAWMMPLVSETMGDPWPLERGKDLLEFPYDALVPGILTLLRANLEPFGEALHRKLCIEMTFRDCILEAASRTVRELEARL